MSNRVDDLQNNNLCQYNNYASKTKTTNANNVPFDNMSKGDTVEISKKLFGKDVISGTIEGMEYDFKKQNFYHERKSEYTGEISNKPTSFKINRGWNIFKPDIISGQIGNSEINISIQKNWKGDMKISGEYSGQPINLTMKKAAFSNSYKLSGNNTDYTISDKIFSCNMKTNGNFEYSKELLPIFYTYAKENIEKQQGEEFMVATGMIY